MNDRKLLPKLSVPILEELLDRQECYCGENLSNHTADGNERRIHIEHVIEKSRAADELSGVATALFYTTRSQKSGKDARDAWLSKYVEDSSIITKLDSNGRNLEIQLRKIEEKIDLIKDSNIQQLREYEKTLKLQIESKQAKINHIDSQSKEVSERRDDALIDRDRVTKKLHASGISTSKLDTTRLAQNVFANVFDKLRSTEVTAVSHEMNRIFLDMIGADPEQNELTLIHRTELTAEFDIKVFGQSDHVLDPDNDLNGASRRAITLAFILALTKVSRVEAPNVIDTPLGMTSGYVKQSILKSLINEGSQIILFLTHSEISEVEPLLDQKAGVVFTLTNPAHYPKMLRHKPSVTDSRVLRCECNHKQTCDICERKNADMEFNA
jgi:DNA sulfur modification protein DndD